MTGEGPVSYFPLGAGQTPHPPQPRLPQSPLWVSEPLHPSPVGPESLRDLDQHRRKAQNSPTGTSVAGTVFTSLAKLPFLGGTFPRPTKSEPPESPSGPRGTHRASDKTPNHAWHLQRPPHPTWTAEPKHICPPRQSLPGWSRLMTWMGDGCPWESLSLRTYTGCPRNCPSPPPAAPARRLRVARGTEQDSKKWQPGRGGGATAGREAPALHP